MTVDLDDPFATPAESRVTARADVISGGRYMLPNRDGSRKTRGFQRVSNMVSAISDQYGLRMWEIQETLRGVAADHALYAEMVDSFGVEMDKDARRDWTNAFMERCKAAAGANRGAQFGNHRHAVIEGVHAGLPLGIQNSLTRRHVSLYANALVRNQLMALPGMQERRILVEELEVVGTLDNIVQDTVSGMLHIADLKTQKRFWSWLEISAQLACYAHGDAMWDNETSAWVDMPPVNLEVGMVLWMPREHPSGEPAVDVYEVDIQAGWATAKRCHEVVKDRAAAKSTARPRGYLRPAKAMTATERYVAMFAGLDSVAEGRALAAEVKAKGAWNAVIQDAAKAAHARLTLTKNMVS